MFVHRLLLSVVCDRLSFCNFVVMAVLHCLRASSCAHTSVLVGLCPAWCSGLLGIPELSGGVAEDRRLL